jgi:predicted nucleotidyltransferase
MRPTTTAETRVADLLAVCRGVLQRPDLHPIAAAFLYGSILTERFRQDSDLDIAVLDRADDPLTFQDQAKLMDALERATGYNVDLRMLRELRPSHRANVLATGRPVSAGSHPDELGRFRRQTLAAARAESAEVERAWPDLLGRLAQLAPAKR